MIPVVYAIILIIAAGVLGFIAAAICCASGSHTWVEFEGHDITPTEGGIIHHSTCWCKKHG